MSPAPAEARSAFVPAMATALLAGLAALAGCTPVPAPAAAGTTEWREFEGSWTATGTRQTLHLGADRQASIASLRGSLLLSGRARPGEGFLAEAIVLSDSDGKGASGMTGRAVWTDDRGDKVFSELRGEGTRTGNQITGTVLGGTGRYAGLVGEYGFTWKFVLDGEGESVQGQSMGLKGRVRVAPPAAAATAPITGASRR